jgi:hypothetical protein
MTAPVGLQVLTEAERDRVWQSTLTGALFRFSDGWQRSMDIGGVTEWRPYRAGTVYVGDVYARAGEKFTEVEQ